VRRKMSAVVDTGISIMGTPDEITAVLRILKNACEYYYEFELFVRSN